MEETTIMTEAEPRTGSSRIVWDQVGERVFETGVEKGVLYLFDKATKAYTNGVAWNGLTGVTESPTGAESTPMWADNVKYVTLTSAEEYGFTIEAFTYPDEFGVCDSTAELVKGASIGQQTRRMFGFSYVTKIGNDVDGMDSGYKIHLVYGAMAKPSEKARKTVNDSPEGLTFSWECDTTPVPVTGFKPTSEVTIDSTNVDKEKMTAIENIIYGSTTAAARLPLPDEIKTLLQPA